MLTDWGIQRPDLDTSGMAVVLRVLLLAGVFSERLKDVLVPFDLAPWEFDVLSALRRSSKLEGLTPKALCVSAQLTSGAMTYRIDRLEERKLVCRRDDQEDRRSITVALTSKGRRLVDEAVGARMNDASLSLGALTTKGRRELARILRDVSQNLEAQLEPH